MHVVHTICFILQACTSNDIYYTNDYISVINGVILVRTYMYDSIIASLIYGIFITRQDLLNDYVIYFTNDISM